MILMLKYKIKKKQQLFCESFVMYLRFMMFHFLGTPIFSQFYEFYCTKNFKILVNNVMVSLLSFTSKTFYYISIFF